VRGGAAHKGRLREGAAESSRAGAAWVHGGGCACAWGRVPATRLAVKCCGGGKRRRARARGDVRGYFTPWLASVPSALRRYARADAYGDRAPCITRLAEERRLGRRLVRGHPMIEAEVVWAVREEMAETACDFIARRTRLAFVDVAACEQALPRVRPLSPTLALHRLTGGSARGRRLRCWCSGRSAARGGSVQLRQPRECCLQAHSGALHRAPCSPSKPAWRCACLPCC